MHQSGLSAEPEPSPGGVEIVSIRSAVGYEHDRSEPVIRLWDEMQYQRRAVHARERETA